MNVRLEALNPGHFERLHLLFDSVCRERRFMAFSEAGPREQTFAYYRHIVDTQQIHFVARQGDELVGWCDVLTPPGQMRAGSGVLGMAVAAAHRRSGIGRQLIAAALAQADDRQLRRVELTVHADNVHAQALYRSVGFEPEGVMRRAWCLDAQCWDVWMMARLPSLA
jgi:ribosomal protein S18 acetylase RimI-like enzyme